MVGAVPAVRVPAFGTVRVCTSLEGGVHDFDRFLSHFFSFTSPHALSTLGAHAHRVPTAACTLRGVWLTLCMAHPTSPPLQARFAGTTEINGVAVNLWKWTENLGCDAHDISLTHLPPLALTDTQCRAAWCA